MMMNRLQLTLAIFLGVVSVDDVAAQWGTAAPQGICKFPPTPPSGGITNASCKQYVGIDWTAESAAGDCRGFQGEFVESTYCEEATVGLCKVNTFTGAEADYVYYEGNSSELEMECYDSVQDAGSYVRAVPIPESGGDLLPEAISALESDSEVVVTDLSATEGTILFTPAAREPKGGLVYFPNVNIEAKAYAVMARAIASYGYLVAVIVEEGNVFVAETAAPARVEAVMNAHVQVPHWAVGGNGRGAISAAAAAAQNPKGLVESLALHDGGVSREQALRNLDLRVYYFTSESNGEFEFIQENFIKIRMPRNKASQYVNLQGRTIANYVFSEANVPGDFSDAFLSKGQQTELVVKATVHMLQNFGLDRSVSAVFDKSYALSQATVCNAVQNGAFSMPSDVNVSGSYGNLASFVNQEPKVYAPKEGSYVGALVQAANPLDITAPAVYYEQALCNTFSAVGVETLLQGDVSGTQNAQPCKVANEEIFENGKGRVDWWTRVQYNFAFASVTFADDVIVDTMDEFLNSQVDVVRQIAPKEFVITPVRLQGNENYIQCRVMAEAAAVQIVEGVVTVQQPDRDPTEVARASPEGYGIEVIAGASAGAVAIVGVAAVLVYRKRRVSGIKSPTTQLSSSSADFKSENEGGDDLKSMNPLFDL